MVKARYEDKRLVVDILSSSFDDNKSVNFVIDQGSTRKRRISKLMEYSFDYCKMFGDVFLSDDKNACALAVLPDKKRTSLKAILLDVKLALTCIGLPNLKKAMNREARIKSVHPAVPFYYLWFIGVRPEVQNTGIGSTLLAEVIAKSDSMERPIYLETSTLRNLAWYEKFGFQVHNELDFGYKLICLKRER